MWEEPRVNWESCGFTGCTPGTVHKKPGLSNRNPEMCRDLSLQLQSPSGTWELLSKNIPAALLSCDFCVQHLKIHPWGFLLPLGMGLRGETGDGLTSLASIPVPQPSVTSWWVLQPRPATCQQRELALCCSAKIVEIISSFLIPASEWLQAQTSAWGVEAASGINSQHKNSWTSIII